MEFSKWKSGFQIAKATDKTTEKDPLMFYSQLLVQIMQTLEYKKSQGDYVSSDLIAAYNQARAEGDWYRDGCPHFNLYAEVADELEQLPDEERIAQFAFPCRAFTLNYPTTVTADRSVLVTQAMVDNEEQLCLWSESFDHEVEQTVVRFATIKTSALRQHLDETLVRVLVNLSHHVQTKSDLVLEDVLNKHLTRYKHAVETNDTSAREDFVNRAKSRGKFGWTVGRSLDTL